MRRAAKRDATEEAIVAALRRCGCGVWYLSGPGLPDLLVRCGGRWLPLEVKSATGRLTKLQQALTWPVVHSPEEALKLFGVKA